MPRPNFIPTARSARAAARVLVRPFEESGGVSGSSTESVPMLPAWCRTFASLSSVCLESGGVSIHRGRIGAVFSVLIPDAVSMTIEELEASVAGAYERIATAVENEAAAGAHHSGLCPVRFWNFIPGIHDPMQTSGGHGRSGEDSINRYMAFNAGRYRAVEQWRSRGAASGVVLAGGIAAATGVGYRGTDLAIHCLAVPRPGRAVENPRQIPAYRYSRRYGPLPPCFARGTVVEGLTGPVLLVGGTASVRGEESIHAAPDGPSARDSLVAQVRETLTNLASLIETGLGGPGGEAATRQLRDVRVYHTRLEDRKVLGALLNGVFAPDALVELVRADICRAELLVEIEGVAGAPIVRGEE